MKLENLGLTSTSLVLLRKKNGNVQKGGFREEIPPPLLAQSKERTNSYLSLNSLTI